MPLGKVKYSVAATPQDVELGREDIL